MSTPIALPCYIETTDGQTRVKDANSVTVADCAPQHAEEIARALNAQYEREEYLMRCQ